MLQEGGRGGTGTKDRSKNPKISHFCKKCFFWREENVFVLVCKKEENPGLYLKI